MANKLTEAFKKTGKAAPKNEIPLVHADEGNGDHTPMIHGMALKSYTADGKEFTGIVATIHGPAGMVSKRMTIPGGVTAARLAELLGDIANW